MQFFAIVIAIFLFSTVCQSEEAYYWREYKGIIPADAILAGKDIETHNVYIGQAYVKSAGLIVGRVVSGERYVFAPYGGRAIVGKFVKVLCGSPDDFYWMKVNSTHFQTTIAHLSPVVGGHEDVSNEYLYVGRATVKGDLKVGKVGTAIADTHHMYYNDEGAEKKLANFELLMYKNGTDNSVAKIKV